MSLKLKARFAVAILPAALFAAVSSTVRAQQFTAVALDTNTTDSQLINPWGVSYSATSPIWVSDNGSGVSTLYSINPVTNAIAKEGLVVSIPGAGNVTGQINNPGTQFNGDNFIFVSEDGTISGWRGALGTTAQTLQTGSTANVYKGLADAVIGGNTYLYAANFRNGTIDVVKGLSTAPNLTGTFTDPSLPAGYAPFNVQNLNGTIYVTYALQDAAKFNDVPGLGNGYVDAYDTEGNLIGRVGSNGTLDAPWGLAIAPTSFGGFAGDLLVGNFGNGTIDIFNQVTDTYLGQVLAGINDPLSIHGLWALTPGNGAGAGSADSIYYTAGPMAETGGVLGFLSANPTPEPGSVAMLCGLFVAGGALLLRRKRFHIEPSPARSCCDWDQDNKNNHI